MHIYLGYYNYLKLNPDFAQIIRSQFSTVKDGKKTNMY